MLAIWEYAFMRHALIAVVLIMPLFAMLGSLVIQNGLAFFSDALGHTALTGIAVGALLGIGQPEWAMLIFAVIFALLMNLVRRSRISSADTVIGVFSSCGIALGLVIFSMNGAFGGLQALLVGDILSIRPRELWMLGGGLLVTGVLWVALFNQLTAVSISATMARSKGVPVRLLDQVLVALIAVVVMLAIRWVGLLIINAMLILPAAAARNVAHNLRSYHLLTLLFGMVSGVVGLALSFAVGAAAGPMIVLTGGLFFFGSFWMREKG